MYFYLRLLKKKERESYTVEEGRCLCELLRAAPGVNKVKSIERHPKGGYTVILDVSQESLYDLIEYVSTHGYQPVF